MSIETADNILHVKNSTMRISRVEVGQTLSVGNIEFDTTTTLTSVTSNGNNTTPYTISSSNVTTGLVTTSNVEVGGELTVGGTNLVDLIYPLGAIYITTSAVSPSSIWAGTTWVAYGEGRTLIGVGSVTDSQPTPETQAFSTVETTGGELKHTLTKAEIPPHIHTYVDRYRNTEGGAGQIFNLASGSQVALSSPTVNTGDGSPDLQGLAHNNLQPYIVTYMWKRTA